MSEGKEYYANGWSHFIDCINFNSSDFDAEAIEFMNEFPRHIMNLLDSHDALLEALRQIFAIADCDEDEESKPVGSFVKIKLLAEAAIALAEKEG